MSYFLPHLHRSQWCYSVKRTEPTTLNQQVSVYQRHMRHDFNLTSFKRKYCDHSPVPSTSMWKIKKLVLWSFVFSLLILPNLAFRERRWIYKGKETAHKSLDACQVVTCYFIFMFTTRLVNKNHAQLEQMWKNWGNLQRQ